MFTHNKKINHELIHTTTCYKKKHDIIVGVSFGSEIMEVQFAPNKKNAWSRLGPVKTGVSDKK